jgi:hypothetical protein
LQKQAAKAKDLYMMKTRVGLWLFILLVSQMGCGSSKSTEPTEKNWQPYENPPNENPKDLAFQDLAALESFDGSGPQSWDAHSNQRFREIFGGYSGKNVRKFIDERIKYFLGADDNLELSPRNFRYTNWTNNPDGEKNKQNGVLLGVNFGTQLWFNGLIDQVPVTMTINSQKITITSPRLGLMLFGPGYTKAIQTKDQETIPLPASYRQAIIIHEGVHSNCTGGLKASDLAIARTAKTYGQFMAGFESIRCGNFHALCPTGNLAGIPACDRHTWGAYSVGVVFEEAVLENLSPETVEWQIMNASRIDQKSRILVDYNAMIQDRATHVDLTSTDQVR